MNNKERDDGKWSPTRRGLLLSVAASFAAGFGSFGGAQGRPPIRNTVAVVLPPNGVKTGLSFGSSIVRLVEAGAIVPAKMRELYRSKGGLPDWAERAMTGPSAEPITISTRTAPVLLNLLWPLGLSTKTAFNLRNPMNDYDLTRFASTSGWTLGEASNGAAYFNQVDTLALNPGQEAAVLEIARAIYRPCCDKSTYFQDCNHGSAMLGLIELAAAQMRSPDKIRRLALAANSFWYPQEYLKTAQYFSTVENRPWADVDPAEVLGARYSSLSGWNRNVNAPLMLTNFISRSRPRQRSQVSCGL